MRAFLSEERNVLRIRAAEPFGECGGPEREWGGGGEGREGFRRHYRGHCPPEIIKLKSNYGLIIVNPPPIPKSFLCSKLGWNRGGGGWRDVCDDWGEDCWTNDEFLGMFGWIVRSEEFIDTTRHDYGGHYGGGEGHETLRRECYFPVAVISLPVTGFEAGLASQVFQAVHSGKMV